RAGDRAGALRGRGRAAPARRHRLPGRRRVGPAEPPCVEPAPRGPRAHPTDRDRLGTATARDGRSPRDGAPRGRCAAAPVSAVPHAADDAAHDAADPLVTVIVAAYNAQTT